MVGRGRFQVQGNTQDSIRDGNVCKGNGSRYAPGGFAPYLQQGRQQMMQQGANQRQGILPLLALATVLYNPFEEQDVVQQTMARSYAV